MSLTDSEASAMFLQQGLQNAQLMAQQQAQLQSLCQAMHFNTIREVYVAILADGVRDELHVCGFPVEFMEEAANTAKLAADRLMISLNLMKEPTA